MKRLTKITNIPSLANLSLREARVFLRVDFNLPHDEKGEIKDDTRIRNSLPTIKHLLAQNTVLVLASHHSDKKQSLLPAAKRLEKLLGKPVVFMPQFWTEETIARITSAKPGTIFMLENTRFHEGEKKNDPVLAKHFAKMANFYINDAFGTAHRVHVSTVGLAEFLPGALGFLMEREVEEITKTLENSQKPFVAIIGGAKVSTKLGMISKLLEAADTVLLGGAVANTFFRTWGIKVGKSLIDEEAVETARSIFWKASRLHTAMILPEDVKTTHAALRNEVANVHHTYVHQDHAIYDIGEATIRHYRKIISEAKTLVWNGPMGQYEDPKFSQGTQKILEAVAKSKTRSLVGGGDTIANINQIKVRKQITHVSTGGGAMLELIEKGTLPALEALRNHR